MRVLVVGSGGREHALAWKLRASILTRALFVLPGNPGMQQDGIECVALSASDYPAIRDYCVREKIDLVVIGPDQALADGLADLLAAAGINAFGPTQAAAKIESSKAYAKDLMAKAGIPTAKHSVARSLPEAEAILAGWSGGVVVKADGLALGKGVVICDSQAEALRAARDFMTGEWGEAGKTLVLEEKLTGRETSAFFLCSGKDSRFLGFACDHKQLRDGGKGPNTGGMGGFTPAEWLPADMQAQVEKQVVAPLLKEMSARGTPFSGMLFVGLMITASGPKVLEFNARFGDPETQMLLPLLESDLLPWLNAAAHGSLGVMTGAPRFKPGACVHVVLAAHGYPGTEGEPVRKGDAIRLPQETKDAKIFFAGVTGEAGNFRTGGGRVLGISALGKDKAEARARAYALAERVEFSGKQLRRDIGA